MAGRIRVDWFRVIVDLESKDHKMNRIAALIGWPRRTILDWRNHDTEPSHAGGEALIALWCQVMLPSLSPEQRLHPRDALPLNVEDLLSAAKASAPARPTAKKLGLQQPA